MNFMNVTLVGEENDVPCTPTATNTAIKIKHGNFKLADNATFDSWEFAIVFPDEQKATHFIRTFKNEMHDFREGMLKDDYAVHIIHFKSPKESSLYADQISMTKDWLPDVDLFPYLTSNKDQQNRKTQGKTSYSDGDDLPF